MPTCFLKNVPKAEALGKLIAHFRIVAEIAFMLLSVLVMR